MQLKFEYYICLTKILEKGDQKINYIELYQNIHISILDSIQKFTNPYIIWALLNLLSRLILRVMNYRENMSFDLGPVFIGIKHLAHNNSEIILDSLIELLKRMMISNLDTIGKRETFLLAINFLETKLMVLY